VICVLLFIVVKVGNVYDYDFLGDMKMKTSKHNPNIMYREIIAMGGI
jgi:hypothetical protein